MTVIAYRDGTLAADRLVSDGNLRVGEATKIKRSKDGYLFGFAGSSAKAAELFAFIDATDAAAGANAVDYEDPMQVQFPGLPDIDGMMIRPDGAAFFVDPDARAVIPIVADFAACGSGNHVAMGAMAAGACATDAVSAAIALCVDCGGGIDTLGLEKKSGKKR